MNATFESDAEDIRANAAITKFLDYYVDPNRPFDYAVMVNGPWGSGKSHLVKEFLTSRSSLKPLYVTLNGISSADRLPPPSAKLWFHRHWCGRRARAALKGGTGQRRAQLRRSVATPGA